MRIKNNHHSTGISQKRYSCFIKRESNGFVFPVNNFAFIVIVFSIRLKMKMLSFEMKSLIRKISVIINKLIQKKSSKTFHMFLMGGV